MHRTTTLLPPSILALLVASIPVARAVEPDARPVLSGGLERACTMREGRAECWSYAGGEERLYSGPATLPGDPGLVSVVVGQEAVVCGLTAKGELHCYGRNGQRKAGPFTEGCDAHECSGHMCADALIRVAAPLTFRSFDPGHQTACGITLEGRLYCWGNNEEGQAGVARPPFPRKPVALAPKLRFKTVAGSHYHVCALTEAGEAWCWGGWDVGQVGAGPLPEGKSPPYGPVKVDTPVRFERISAGYNATCALTKEGEAWCWGSNEDNWMGLASPFRDAQGNVAAFRPVRVGEGVTFRDFAVGWGRACGATTDGMLKCFFGEADRLAEVTRPMRAVAVGAGFMSFCALTPERDLACWGGQAVNVFSVRPLRAPRVPGPNGLTPGAPMELPPPVP